jgi:hypothetical protein
MEMGERRRGRRAGGRKQASTLYPGLSSRELYEVGGLALKSKAPLFKCYIPLPRQERGAASVFSILF